jgi:farnesyl-diphosphate farnesyltransferase
MITELFLEAIGPNAPRQELYRHCESFGIGLQLVNIVKDVTDDHARGVCYLPRRMCEAEGFDPERLLEPEFRPAAKRVLGLVIDRAHEHLCSALEYTLQLPASHHQLRLFCLLPLWLALETLRLAREHDGVFTPGMPVKVSRADVQRIVVASGALCRDDAGLKRAVAALVEAKPGVSLATGSEGWSAS